MFWKQKEDVAVEEVEGKMLIFDPTNFNFYELNETMALVWVALKNRVSEEDITNIMTNNFDINYSAAQQDVKEAISLLKEKGLIELEK